MTKPINTAVITKNAHGDYIVEYLRLVNADHDITQHEIYIVSEDKLNADISRLKKAGLSIQLRPFYEQPCLFEERC